MKKFYSFLKCVVPVFFVAMVLCGFSFSLIYYLHKDSMYANDPTNFAENITPAAAPINVVEDEINKENIGEEFSNMFTELELHDSTLSVLSMEESSKLIAEGRKTYENNGGPSLIDVQKYISKCFEDDGFNSLEAKSYIYHMMLNSIDYIQSAQGTLTYAQVIDDPFTVSFQTDILNHCSYESQMVNGCKASELFVSDGVEYIVDLKTNKYSQALRNTQEDFTISDNDRVMTLDDGQLLAINRPDKSNLGIASNACLYPQSYAMSRLFQFDMWNISEITQVLNRSCAVVSGKYRDTSFKMYVDINTGILLKYEEFDDNNERTGFFETTSLELNQNINVKQFDKKNYAEELKSIN